MPIEPNTGEWVAPPKVPKAVARDQRLYDRGYENGRRDVIERAVNAERERDELRAALQHSRESTGALINQAAKQIRELEAEVERLQGSHLASEVARANQRNDELRSEVERLTEAHRYCDETIRKHQQSWAAEHAEIDRLRAALTEITDLDLEGDASLADAIAIADETLHPPPVNQN